MSGKADAKSGAAVKQRKGTGKGEIEEKAKDALQAVIIADSFQDRFKPFTLETPRCLLPLANTPLIEYTLEYLALNGVQEVFIYCGAHEDKVEKYIYDSPKWGPNSGLLPFASLEFIRVSDAHSQGDFLRDLDKRGVIGGDFILVHGDLVSNIPLDQALAKHKARRDANRDACMTMILRSGGESLHRTEPKVVSPVFVLNPETGRCLHYEEIHRLQSDRYITLEPSILDENLDIDIRKDLIDCGIDICTPDVLALWSESFDYELPRKNFLHGVLKDWELNGKMIYAEVTENGYGARVSNLQLYDSISQDILGRWTYPFVPDANLLPNHGYARARNGSYLEKGLIIGDQSTISRSIVGKGTEVGRGSSVIASIVGRGCSLGDNVRIEGSHIWDYSTVADGTVISRSILAGSVVVGKGCCVPEGSLLSFGTQLSDGISLPATPPAAVSILSQNSHLETDTSLVGCAGKGAQFWEENEDGDDQNSDDNRDPAALEKTMIYTLQDGNTSASTISTLAPHDSDDDDTDSQAPFGLDETSRTRLLSFASDDSGMDCVKSSAFHADAVNGLVEALRADDGGDFDSAKLEFMGLRLAHNASDSMMRRVVAAAFACRAVELLEHGLEPTKAAGRAFKASRGALKFVKEIGVGGDEDDNVKEQAEFALALQKALLGMRRLEMSRAGVLLAAVLQQLYNEDVLEEEGVLAWWADERAAEGDSMSTVRMKCCILIEWLENADEDSDDDK